MLLERMRGSRVRRDMRVRLWLLAAALGFVSAPSAVLAEIDAFGPYASSSEFTIVLDWDQPWEEVLTSLAEAGFSTVASIPGLPPQYGNTRLVTVSSADSATRSALLSVDGVVGVRSVYRSSDLAYPIYTTGQVIAKFAPGTTAAYVRELAARHGGSVARQINGLPQAYVFDIDEASQSVGDFHRAVTSDANVVYCHPSIFVRLQAHQAAAIEDPLYPFQWHLNNTGQLEDGVPGADIEVEDAWNITLGGGAVVAVIDDSIQRDHEDLAANYLTGYDFIDNDADPSPTYGPSPWYYSDSFGDAHGTAVSGLICAAANTIGVRGVAPQASLIGCKIPLGDIGAELDFMEMAPDQMIADAFLFAEQNGAMAINNSWGGPGMAILPTVPNTFLLPDVISDAIDEVATNGRDGLGVLVLFSSGNDDIPISFDNMYAAIPNTMAIGATLRDDTLSCYSSFGPEQSVVAPGGGYQLPEDFGYYWNLLGRGYTMECLQQDMATTDNMEVPGVDFFSSYFMDEMVQGHPIRGYNPAMKFLSVWDPMFCLDPNDLMCVPLVPDDYALEDFPDPNYTRRFSGTSAACPVATGVAALVFSTSPGLTAENVRNIIEHTAEKSPLTQERFDGVTGHNDRYGHGRVNAREAVLAASSGKTWPSPVEDVQNVSSQALARLFWTNPENGVSDILVVRSSTGMLEWSPTDGIEYDEGQMVASGVMVVSTGVTESLDQTGLPIGQYEYGIFVRNASGFYSWGRRASFTSAGAVTAPLASLSASVTAGKAPLTVHFAGGAIDESGIKNLAFTWSFGDGSTGFGAAVDHTYVLTGDYQVRLTVTNTYGQSAQAVTRISVLPEFNLPPRAGIIASPTSGTSPLVVRFQGIGTDDDGVVVRYDWDFGDGRNASGQLVEHTYLSAGTFGVKLTVTDDQGATATDSVLISVSSPGATAAATDPEDALGDPVPTTSSCGLGAPLGVAGALLGLFVMMVSRRRD